MMLPTHALAGMALALPVAAVAPEFAPVAFAAGFAGGILPDLDMYAGHRKTLHYPVYFSVLAVGALGFALAVPTTLSVGLAFLLLGAALHSVTDVFGGGLELRPWEGTSDRAVYDHYRGQWLAPRRLVGYDGSPGDLLLSSLLAVPLLLTVDGAFRLAVFAGLAVAVVYTAVRRILPTLAERLVDDFGPVLPAVVLAQLPTRYQQGSGTDQQ